QARLVTRMPERRGIAMTSGILFAAFMVSLGSRAPGRVNGRPGMGSVGVLLERSAQRQGCRSGTDNELSLSGITAETDQPSLFNGNQS
ncbi:MAG: hypothetical protein OXI33_14705, partial [Chloroflexota bacterium]|nr:hypothetical protein [Chloroflexota bacterium]